MQHAQCASVWRMDINLTDIFNTAIGALAGSLITIFIARSDRRARARSDFNAIVSRLLEALNGWFVAEAGMEFHERSKIAMQARLASSRHAMNVASEAVAAAPNDSERDAMRKILHAVNYPPSLGDARRLMRAFQVSGNFAEWRSGTLDTSALSAKVSGLLEEDTDPSTQASS